MAQGCWPPCRLLFGSWRWQELLALPGNRSWPRVGSHEEAVLESISQPHAGTRRAVSAECGGGREQLPLFSLALNRVKAGPGRWVQRSRPASPPRLPRAGCTSRGDPSAYSRE